MKGYMCKYIWNHTGYVYHSYKRNFVHHMNTLLQISGLYFRDIASVLQVEALYIKTRHRFKFKTLTKEMK